MGARQVSWDWCAVQEGGPRLAGCQQGRGVEVVVRGCRSHDLELPGNPVINFSAEQSVLATECLGLFSRLWVALILSTF